MQKPCVRTKHITPFSLLKVYILILIEFVSNGLIRLIMEYLQVVILGCNQPQDATMYLI